MHNQYPRKHQPMATGGFLLPIIKKVIKAISGQGVPPKKTVASGKGLNKQISVVAKSTPGTRALYGNGIGHVQTREYKPTPTLYHPRGKGLRL